MARAAALEARLGHRFGDAALLEQALTHRGSRLESNERLEFLGDGVLRCAVGEALYRRYPGLREGGLHRLQESLIREEALAEAARGIALDEVLGAALPKVSASTLADTLEALFGAVFLDAGYAAARECILKVLAPQLARLDPERPQKDAKSRLQEIVQARFRATPVYQLTASRGPAHERVFEVECRVPDLALAASGSGTSRQRAEQAAASAMLERLAER